MIKRILIILIIAFLIILLAACNKYGIEDPKPELIFPSTVASEIDLTVGDTLRDNYIMFKGLLDFSANDIIIKSSKPDVAIAEITSEEFPIYIYFDIKALSEGEALIYAQSADGSVNSEVIRVKVVPRIEVSQESESVLDTDQLTINETEALIESESITEAESEIVTAPIIDTEPQHNSNINDDIAYTFTLNTDSKKFHLNTCTFANRIKDENKATYAGTRDELIEDGYSPCKTCKP